MPATDLRKRVRQGDLAALTDPALPLHLMADGPGAAWWLIGAQHVLLRLLHGTHAARIDAPNEDTVRQLLASARRSRRWRVLTPAERAALTILERYAGTVRPWFVLSIEGTDDRRIVECGFNAAEAIQTFPLWRAEAIDPDTAPERLLVLAQVWPEDVRQNPALPLLRVMHPGIFEWALPGESTSSATGVAVACRAALEPGEGQDGDDG